MSSSAPEIENDTMRLIEAGFPCHQVGAETQRERDTGKSPPPNRLHIWWARRPLTPARAAILGATLSANSHVDEFLEGLGIVKPVALVPGGGKWTLVKDIMLRRVHWDNTRSKGSLDVDATVQRHFAKEVNRRRSNLAAFSHIQDTRPDIAQHPTLLEGIKDNQPFEVSDINVGSRLIVVLEPADPDRAKIRLAFKKQAKLGGGFSWSDEDTYGYPRAFTSSPVPTSQPLVVLDPTAGGGSIPLEALRLGHHVIANDLNPVATIIQYATLQFPRQFGKSLTNDISVWGNRLIQSLDQLEPCFALNQSVDKPLLVAHSALTAMELQLVNTEHIVDYLYYRQVSCPHCGGRTPLLNSFWLSKEDSDKWAVRLIVRDKMQVDIEPYEITGAASKHLVKELDTGTVVAGRGTCAHCKQVIDGDEIKAQARGESTQGKMVDHLFCVVAFRYLPKFRKDGTIDRFSSGDRTGEIKTTKARYFRVPNNLDFDALLIADQTLQERWDHFERLDLIPTENIPAGHKTGNPGGAGSGTDKPLKLGTEKWFQMFSPRQLLGHLTLVEALHDLKPLILKEHGIDRGKALITYLQFVIDKGVDYNSRQTFWDAERGIRHTFSRHDFGFRWCFGEMVFSGPDSGAAWTLNQVLDAYGSMADLVAQAPSHNSLKIINGSGAMMESIADESVDLVVNDPPYYNNVMYAELADYFYVWQKRTLRDIFPELFTTYLTDKQSEAVANSFRDGSTAAAKDEYERLMREMYAECHRVTKVNGRMVLMFTHKSQDGWETLTQALIHSGWTITATYPIESETSFSLHIQNNASASSAIFIVCRKRDETVAEPALWKAFGGRGVQQRIIDEVQQGLVEFEALNLRPVDTMVASYGRALRVLSEKWPVLDGDETVSPIRALNEASRVVAQYQIHKLTEGRLKVEDLTPEAAMAVTLYGIAGLQPIRFDEVLNVARSLGIAIESTTAGYDASGRTIGYATEATGRRAGRGDDIVGYHAPLVRKGSNLRLAKPEERNERRLASPQHEWDVLQGMLLKYREGDIPVARAYLAEHADGEQSKIIDLLRVWTKEMDDESLRQEGEMILFGLQGA